MATTTIRRLAGLGAAAAMSSALLLGLPTAAHAAGYCDGTVLRANSYNGMSSRLIRSYDGNSLCVNTWNQTGGYAWTEAVITKQVGGPDAAKDYGWYSQYASTGWVAKGNGCWWWGGTPVSPGANTFSLWYDCV
ncbi:hypothetical protein ACFV4P_28550 [Kitasatospora sp. NPDC059795]|uniref:hypothetical protein n=1 Tax=Kitasatospora sp. NPDC059795 TaxID=3346949 RepID=UPI003658461F